MSRTGAKKRKYWAKVNGIRLHRAQRRYETSMLDAVSDEAFGPEDGAPESGESGEGSADDDAPEEESDEVRQRPQVSYPMATTMRR